MGWAPAVGARAPAGGPRTGAREAASGGAGGGRQGAEGLGQMAASPDACTDGPNDHERPLGTGLHLKMTEWVQKLFE